MAFAASATWLIRHCRDQPHGFEERDGAVAESEDEFDLRALLDHLLDAAHRQTGEVLDQLAHVPRPCRRRVRPVQLVLRDVVVKMLPCRPSVPVRTQFTE